MPQLRWQCWCGLVAMLAYGVLAFKMRPLPSVNPALPRCGDGLAICPPDLQRSFPMFASGYFIKRARSPVCKARTSLKGAEDKRFPCSIPKRWLLTSRNFTYLLALVLFTMNNAAQIFSLYKNTDKSPGGQEEEQGEDEEVTRARSLLCTLLGKNATKRRKLDSIRRKKAAVRNARDERRRHKMIEIQRLQDEYDAYRERVETEYEEWNERDRAANEENGELQERIAELEADREEETGF